LIFNKIFKIRIAKELDNYASKQFVLVDISPSIYVKLALALLSSFGLTYILYYSPSIPIWTLINGGDLVQASIQRVASKREFAGIPYIRTFFGIILIPALAYYSYIIAHTNKSLSSWLFFSFQSILAFILLTFDLQKAPIAFFILGFIIVHTFLTNGVSPKWFFIVFISSVFLILLGYELTTDASMFKQFTDFHSAFYGRIFLVGYLGFPLSMELFPDSIIANTALFGIPEPLREIYNIEATDSARELMKYINPVGVREGSANLISGYYLGEAWASFRYSGLLMAPIVVGCVIQFIHLVLLHLPKHPLFVAFYALISTKWLITSGFSNFLTLKIILFPLLTVFFLYIFMNTLTRIRRLK